MKPPIISIENGDVNIFRSLDQAERYLEPEDIEKGVYMLYDSEGRRLRADADYHPRRVQLRAAELQPTHSIELVGVLRQFLVHVGEDAVWVNEASLEELITKMISKYETG